MAGTVGTSSADYESTIQTRSMKQKLGISLEDDSKASEEEEPAKVELSAEANQFLLKQFAYVKRHPPHGALGR